MLIKIIVSCKNINLIHNAHAKFGILEKLKSLPKTNCTSCELKLLIKKHLKFKVCRNEMILKELGSLHTMLYVRYGTVVLVKSLKNVII